MRKTIKGFIIGVLTTTLLCSTFIYAAGNTQLIEALFNDVNIAVNNQTVGVIGENFALDNGNQVPYSILYKGTTYLPIRKVAELLNKEVTWDGNTRTVGLKENSMEVPAENSRLNPAKINQSIIFEEEHSFDGKSTLEMTLTEVVRGSEAWDIIYDDDKFNKEPRDGKEYILAKFKIKAVSIAHDYPIEINDGHFEAVSKDGSVYDKFVLLRISERITYDFYEGYVREGYTYLEVDIGDQPLVRYIKGDESYVWFDLN